MLTTLKSTLSVLAATVCLASGANAAPAAVTKILSDHCAECHHQGRKPDVTKNDAALDAMSQAIVEAASSGVMPPSPRDKLTAAELQIIRSWAEGQ